MRAAMVTPALCGAWLVSCLAAVAQTPAPASAPQPARSPKPERFSLHAQATQTQQYHGAFVSAYAGTNSLFALADTQKTIDATLFLGAALWKGGAVYLNPEIDQGFGLGNPGVPGQGYLGTVGVAGFVSGEAYKVGRYSSYGRIQRAFVRQTFDSGGDVTTVEPDQNQLGGTVTAKHTTLTLGKFAVTDVFDNNAYAHDPKNDFLNWSIIDMGSFDYAADAWGYTYGTTAEFVHPKETLRLGLFQLSAMPNQIEIEHQPLLQYSPIVEYERDTSLFGGHAGAIKLLLYGDDGYFGPYALAVQRAAGTGTPPNTATVRGRYMKVGGGLNVAQEVAPHVGVFLRASAMNGTFEADEFSDIDRSLSGGLSIDGGLYHRPNDTFGIAGAANAISGPAQKYFGAGGLGILVGDGALDYAGERIFETYYALGIAKGAAITADYQRVANPAYNLVRGPVSVYGLRYHAQI
jgi:high affinity Mn2+ porin